MARPQKKGLDYFPFDVDYFDDYKIIDLLNEYGPLGTTIYEIVISKVYKNGYYLEVPLDKLATQIVRIIGNRWIKDKNLVVQVIQYCADLGLFNNALLTQSVITSAGIQRRYSEVTVRNKVDKSKYWLLGEKTNSQVALVSAPKNIVSATETNINVTKTNVNATSIPQKERKVNKSKLNESRIVIQLPCLNGTYPVTQEQLYLLQQTYPDIDVMQSFRKMYDYFTMNTNNLRSLDAMDNRIRLWLSQDTAKAKAEQKKQHLKQSNNQSESNQNTSYDITAFDKYDIFE